MLLLSMLGLLAGCEGRLGYEAVDISPGYGYVDGCDSVQVSGHGFGEDPSVISATIGPNPLEDITFPDPAENPFDVGFVFFGTIPTATGEAGPVDVTVTRSDTGETSTIENGFYYVACPASPTVEAIAPTTGVAAGTTISLAGCDIDTALYNVTLHEPLTGAEVAEADLTAVCSTAVASFAAPDLEDGTYDVVIRDAATGAALIPAVYPCFPDTADTAASECVAAFQITYGGA